MTGGTEPTQRWKQDLYFSCHYFSIWLSWLFQLESEMNMEVKVTGQAIKSEGINTAFQSATISLCCCKCPDIICSDAITTEKENNYPPHLLWFVRGDTSVFSWGSMLANGQEGVWSRAISHNRMKSVYKSSNAHATGNEMIHEMCECAYKCPPSVYVSA